MMAHLHLFRDRKSVCLAVSLCLAVLSSGSKRVMAQTQARIDYDVPTGWVEEAPASRMRYTQFKLPKTDTDQVDASMVVYYFGGAGGTAQANLERWVGQMSQPDGSAAKGTEEIKRYTIHGMQATVLKISGTYKQSMGPMRRQGSTHPGYRMLAAVLETEAGPFFFKLVGPEQTVKKWENSFQTFLESVKLRK